MEQLLPINMGNSAFCRARGIKAGRWIFATGVSAGLAGVPDMNLSGAPAGEYEAGALLDELAAVLAAGGATLPDCVRLDQYYTNAAAVGHYQQMRKQRFSGQLPASTSVLIPGLLLPAASMELHAIAALSENRHTTPGLDVDQPPFPGRIGGDFLFLTGQFATAGPDAPGSNGFADAARVPPGTFWGGQPSRVEAEFVMQRLATILSRAGSDLTKVLKAQVYLTDVADIPVFNQVWRDAFGDNIPATTLIPTGAGTIGLPEAHVEINVVALRKGALASRDVIESDSPGAFWGHPAAVRSGDLLFLSGLMANDEHGLVASARRDPHQPYFGSSAEAQVDCILAKAQAVCARVGTSLAQVVRIQQFQTDLSEFHATQGAWRRMVGALPLPVSAIQVPALPIPGCTILMDLWMHVS